ncbi:MAG: hypothetical protein R3F11_12690 [Verrucomicrobiales bacterium]
MALRLAWNDAGETPNTHFVYMDTGEIPVIVDVHNLPRKKDMRAGDTYARRRNQRVPRHRMRKRILRLRARRRCRLRQGRQEDRELRRRRRRQARPELRQRDAPRSKAISTPRSKRSTTPAPGANSSATSPTSSARRILTTATKAVASVQGFQGWNDVIDDFHAHLEANEIDPAKEDIRLGSLLEIDAEKETFVGDTATPEALALLTREYRKGYEVPEKV